MNREEIQIWGLDNIGTWFFRVEEPDLHYATVIDHGLVRIVKKKSGKDKKDGYIKKLKAGRYMPLEGNEGVLDPLESLYQILDTPGLELISGDGRRFKTKMTLTHIEFFVDGVFTFAIPFLRHPKDDE